MKAFKAVRLAFITSSIVYIFYLVAKGVSKTLRRDVRYVCTYLFLALKFETILEYFHILSKFQNIHNHNKARV